MHVGILQFELIVRESRSLKDKRRVVKSIKDRLHREHLVSVAEVAALDHHRLAVMGLAVVANSAAYVQSVLDRVTAKLRALPGAELGAVSRDVFSGESLPTPDVDEDGQPLWMPEESRTAADEPSRGHGDSST